MVLNEAVFLTVVIDSWENHEVAIVNVPGAFMQVDMNKLMYVRLTGGMVQLLLEIEKDLYQNCVVYENGEMAMYVELLKALYGMIRAA